MPTHAAFVPFVVSRPWRHRKLTLSSQFIQTDQTTRLDGLHAAFFAIQNGDARSAIVADVVHTKDTHAVLAVYVKPLVDAMLNRDPIRSVIQIQNGEDHASAYALAVEDDNPSLETVVKASLSLEHKIRLPEMKGSSSHSSSKENPVLVPQPRKLREWNISLTNEF